MNKKGRPPKYDIAQEAQDLLDWSLRDDSLNLLGFCNPKDYDASQMSQWANEHPDDFGKAYKKAKERIALRRQELLTLGKLNYGDWNRYQGAYDTFLHAHEEGIKDREAERRRVVQSVENANLAQALLDVKSGKLTQPN